MLIAFRTSNFRSIRDEIEFSMMIPSWASLEGRVGRPIPPRGKLQLGTVAAIYGPNASGKSNVLAAMFAMAKAVADSHQHWDPTAGAPHEPFLLDIDHRDAPTMFEIELLIARERWQYGYRLDRDGVVEEWLYSYPRGKRRVWFERQRPDDFYFGKSLVGRTTTLRELTRPNSLFLSVGAANNHPELTKVAQWFTNRLSFATNADHNARTLFTTSRLDSDEYASQIQELLRFADLGITRVEHRDATIDNREGMDTTRSSVNAFDPRPRDRLVGYPDRVARALTNLGFYHSPGDAVLTLEQESQGTQAWFALLGSLVTTLRQGYTLLVDELDSSLHPYVTAHLIDLFRDPKLNANAAQLIFSTHDTSLLGNLPADAPLNRDEIWFTEKDTSGVTRLYPLTDFRPRKQENLERGYLYGRYGAVPVIRDRLPAAEA